MESSTQTEIDTQTEIIVTPIKKKRIYKPRIEKRDAYNHSEVGRDSRKRYNMKNKELYDLWIKCWQHKRYIQHHLDNIKEITDPDNLFVKRCNKMIEKHKVKLEVAEKRAAELKAINDKAKAEDK